MDTYLRFTLYYICLLPWCVYVLGQEQCREWQEHDRWLRPQTEGINILLIAKFFIK